MKQRIEYIDFLKGIGIFLVILGHHTNCLTDWIYSFHMPLFFMLAGLFHKNEEKYINFFYKKVKSLVIPYFFFATTLFLFWLSIGRKFGESALNKTPIREAFVGIFYGGGVQIKGVTSMEWGIPMWFPLCLFVICNIFFFISKFSVKKVILIEIILVLISSFLSNKEIMLPWSIERAFLDIVFYTFGYYMKNFIIDKGSKKDFSITGILCLVVNILIYINREEINNLFNNKINLYYILAGFFGSIAFIELFKIVKSNKIIEYLGKNSIVLLAFHGRAMTFIKLIAMILNKNLVEGVLSLDILYSIFQTVLCIPAIYVLNKYFPYLIGKSARK